MTNATWIRDCYAKAREIIVEDGRTPTIDVHKDGDDGRVVKILLDGPNDTIRITWGHGTLQDYW